MLRMAMSLVFIACLAAFPACGTSNDGGRFDGSGYTFEIADGWEDTTADAPSVEDLGLDDPALNAINVDGTIAAEEQDGFGPNLAIVTTESARGVTAEKLARQNLETQRSQGSLPPGAGGGSIDATGAEVERTELGGEPAASYELVASAPPGEVRQRLVYSVFEGTAYALTYSGLDAGQFEENLPAVEAMLESWTWD